LCFHGGFSSSGWLRAPNPNAAYVILESLAVNGNHWVRKSCSAEQIV